ncbi:MAG TPA: hypothetical protein VGH28_20030 [Polyangiaceae bacterium]|jgi:hypothetical protein
MDAADLLSGSEDGVRALAAATVDAWKALLEHVVSQASREAPAELVLRLVAIDDTYDRWVSRAASAAAKIESPYFSTIKGALRPFGRWLRAGVELHAPASRMAIEAHLAALAADDGADVCDRLVAFAETLSTSAPVDLVARAWKLVASRSLVSDPGVAADAARRAEALYREGNYVQDARVARRMVAGALLVAARYEDAFAILDDAMREPMHALARIEAAAQLDDSAEPKVFERIDLASVALWGHASSPEWVRALGALAEAEESPLLWARFERALEGALASAVDLEELADEADIARTNGHAKTAAAISRAANED